LASFAINDTDNLGDGIHDDTAAINASMFLGPRCLGQDSRFTNPVCESSTVQPAIVYFPPGTYRVSQSIIMPYNTLVFGDGLNMPTILASSNFTGIAVLDSDPYYPGIDPGENWYQNQNNFYRQVRNLIIDITNVPWGPSTATACIHWQVAQATSLQNLVFNMRVGGTVTNNVTSNTHTGIFMENGSGGFMRDLIFNGGGLGFFLGYVLHQSHI
jgi:glucan 1,3-beta-glucosidase